MNDDKVVPEVEFWKCKKAALELVSKDLYMSVGAAPIAKLYLKYDRLIKELEV